MQITSKNHRNLKFSLNDHKEPVYGVDKSTLLFDFLNWIRPTPHPENSRPDFLQRLSWYRMQTLNLIGSWSRSRRAKSGKAFIENRDGGTRWHFPFDPRNSQNDTLLSTPPDKLLALMQLLKQSGKSEEIGFLDVGANWGFYTFMGARIFGFKVTAFEPNPQILDTAVHVIQELKVSSLVTYLPYAVSDTIGQTDLQINTFWSGMGSIDPEFLQRNRASPFLRKMGNIGVPISRTHRVKRVTIDSLDLKGYSLVKIDIEGHELPAMRGALGFLARELPWVYFEIQHMKSDKRSETCCLLSEIGYGFYEVELETKHNSLVLSKIDDFVSTDSIDILALPESCLEALAQFALLSSSENNP